MTVTARYASPHASRYLQQLCKHFAHKVPARFDAHDGEVEFPAGRCVLAAEGGVLVMHCTATEAASEPLLVKIVTVHLERFAWRDGPLNLVWERDGQPATELMAALAAMPDPHGEGPGRRQRE